MSRIHTLVLLDMDSGETLLDCSYDYEGPVALCGGSGGSESTTNTVDYAYNARMATLSEEQQEWAREYFQVWKEYQKPYEIAQAQANLEVLPKETGLYKNQLDAADSLLPQDKLLIEAQFREANGLIPGETSLAINQTQHAERLLPIETDYYENQIEQANRVMESTSDLYEQALDNAGGLMPLESELYKKQMAAVGQILPRETDIYSQYLDNAVDMSNREADLYDDQIDNVREVMGEEKEHYTHGLDITHRLLPQQAESGEHFLAAVKKGIDVNERMGLAEADTAFAWRDAHAAALRANARIGINPNSGRFQGIMAALDTHMAGQMAAARTQARVGGEQENFQRMAQGAAYNGAGMAMQTVLPLKPQIGSYNAGNAALGASQALKPQTGNYNNALANLQGSQAVKPQVQQPDLQANSAIRNTRTIISHAPAGTSSEILKGVTYLKG